MRDSKNIFAQIEAILNSPIAREAKARHIVEIVRRVGNYRWVGLYSVNQEEIEVIGWSGSGPPAHPRFPVTHGLCGAAVASRATINVVDVTGDPRYLTTFGSTRSEIVVPILNRSGGVVGVIDVESERIEAFGKLDEAFLEECARSLLDFWAT